MAIPNLKFSVLAFIILNKTIKNVFIESSLIVTLALCKVVNFRYHYVYTNEIIEAQRA